MENSEQLIVMSTRIPNLIILSMLISVCVAQRVKNLIINGNFTQPYFTEAWRFFPSSILGWSCTKDCELNNCAATLNYFVKGNSNFPFCQGKVIDLNSFYKHEVVSQKVGLKSGWYKLGFNYFYPQEKASKKQFSVKFNGKQILFFHPQQDKYLYPLYFEKTVEGFEFNNSLSFANSGLNDGVGFKINNVSLFRVVNEPIEQLADAFFGLSLLTGLAAFPGGRIIFGEVLSFCINIDRYEFYAYHKRLYSYNEQLLLREIYEFEALKGMLFSHIIREAIPSCISTLEAFFDSLNFKNQYIKYSSFFEEINNNNFSTYIKDFIIFSLPAIATLMLLFHFLFRLLFNHPVSKWLRQYYFLGIILPLIFEGNIEQITFFVFAQYKSYFSLTFKHKLFNVFIALFFFIAFFMCFGFYLFCKYHYKSKARFVCETNKSSFREMVSQHYDRGISIFLYGATHQLMIEYPTAQLAVLASIQIFSVIKKYNFRELYSSRLFFYVSLSNSLIRLYFQLSTYLYQKVQNSRMVLNEKYHLALILLLISKMALEIIISLLFSIMHLIKSYRKSNTKIHTIETNPAKKMQSKKVRLNKIVRFNIVHVDTIKL